MPGKIERPTARKKKRRHGEQPGRRNKTRTERMYANVAAASSGSIDTTARKSESDAKVDRAKAFQIARDNWCENVMRTRRLPQRAKLVAWVLSRKFNRGHFDRCGELLAYPAISTIDKEAGMSKRTVLTALRELVDRRYIAIRHGRGGRGYAAGNRYMAVTPGASVEKEKRNQQNDNAPAFGRSGVPGVNGSGVPGSTAAVYPATPNLMTDSVNDPMMQNSTNSGPIDKRSARSMLFSKAGDAYGPSGRSVVAKAERDGVDQDDIKNTLDECVENGWELREFAYHNWQQQ
jgi:hypothetical protein